MAPGGVNTSRTNTPTQLVKGEYTKLQQEKTKTCFENSGGVTSKMRACSKQELEYQDKLLNKYYKLTMKSLDTLKRTELKKVQRLWIKYRDAKCGFYYGLSGGTMDLIIGDDCLVDMTTKRAEELKSIATSE